MFQPSSGGWSRQQLLLQLTSLSADEDKVYDHRYGHTVRDAKQIRAKLFSAADVDGDKMLNRDELADFLHPGQSSPVQLFLMFCIFSTLQKYM